MTVPTLEQDASQFVKIVNTHLTGSFLMAREVARHMIEHDGGAIVNFSSIAGLLGLPRRNAYGAAKAGLIAMTKSMACEWAAHRVRVNAVAPGYVETDLVKKLVTSGFLDKEEILRRTPMGRMIAPAEIAEAVCFLASPAASAITGVVLSVDAGWQAYGAPGDAFYS
jgi:NAD(P)-dependent dehydrogenase (short-subunit alcohol dehydrogenase family)